MPIGPPLPPHLASQAASSSSEDEANIGPALPPGLMKRSAERDETENPKKAKNEDAIELDSDDSGDFGPALPGPASKGPSLPPQFRKMLAEQNPLYEQGADLEKYARPIEEVMQAQEEDNDEPTVGPVLSGQQLTEEEQAELERESIIRRAEKMKQKIETGSEKKLERESWMTELPALRTGVKLENQTTFRKHASAAATCGRSEWTKTPGGEKTKASAAERRKEDKQKVLNLAEWERNQKQLEKMKSLKKNQESMLQAHQRKLEEEAEKNPSGPKERVAFDRERDMQGSIIDEAKRKALLKKQMGLGNRFATGASKFL